MTQLVRAENGSSGLRARPAAYGVIDRCMTLQASRRPRSWLARQIGISPLAPEARSWFAGALGELEVARVLESLGTEWSIFHSVPVGENGADVDHLLIGPPGVFTLNTKAVGGHVWVGRTKILVSGGREEFVAKSEREARRVHKRLRSATGSSVFVRPVLVFVDPDRLTIRDNPASVSVVTSAELIAWLGDQTPVYPPERVAELVRAADQPSTWLHDSAPLTDVRRQTQRFERLGAEVAEAARRMRPTKVAAGLSLAATGVVVTGLMIPTAITDFVASLAR